MLRCDPNDLLKTRVWKRGVTTPYTYDNAGSLQRTTYSGGSVSTVNVTNTYDRRGRLTSVAQGSFTNFVVYNDANVLLSETFTHGVLDGLTVSRQFDPYLRRTNLSLSGASLLSRTVYEYDAASRLQTVTDDTGAIPYSATYTYLANSPLVSQVVFKTNNTTRLTTTKTFDNLNRLVSITSVASGPAAATLPVSYGYQYNNVNQRTRAVLADGSYWIYTYDPLGQVTSGKKYWSDGTPVAGQQFEYAFDDIGNRTGTPVATLQAVGSAKPATQQTASTRPPSGTFPVTWKFRASPTPPLPSPSIAILLTERAITSSTRYPWATAA